MNGVSFLFQSDSLVLPPWGRKVSEVNRAHLLICPSEEDTLGSGADTSGKYCCGYLAVQCWEFDNRR